MYHLMLEIKTQQKVLDRRVNKLLEKLEKDHHSKNDRELLKEIKKQQTILDEKMLALMDLFELCHDKISRPEEKGCSKDGNHEIKLDIKDPPKVETEKLDETPKEKIELKPLINEDSSPPKENGGSEHTPHGKLAEKSLGLHPLLEAQNPPQEMGESSGLIPPRELQGNGPGQHPLGMAPDQLKLTEAQLPPGQHPSGMAPVHPKLGEVQTPSQLENQVLSTNNQRIMGPTDQVFSAETPETETMTNAHGFAYSKVEGMQSGVVKFNIAGPLQNMELVSDGLRVQNVGVYQINYSVVLKASGNGLEKAKFQMMINDTITIDSSTTESARSQQITSTQLFSLIEGDVVKLVAELSEGMSYSQATLQLIQIA